MKLKTAIGTYPHTSPLKDGSVKSGSVEFEFVDVSPIIAAFRRMVRGLEFDVSEMAITTYLAAREAKKAFTAIPVFPVRAFHHQAASVNAKSGVREPKDLAGKRVGVRAYTVTTGVWARGILAHEYGLDLDKVTWVVFDEEHVLEFKAPANVEKAAEGATMADMLASGELAAAIGAGKVDSPDVRPLIPDAANAEKAWHAKTGVLPINHTLVVKDELLGGNPKLAGELYETFDQARRRAAGDEVPAYGIGPNRPALETVIQFAHEQHILSSVVRPEDIFAQP